jgi:micrococcal nuclease
MNSDEIDHPDTNKNELAQQAKSFNSNLVAGKEVLMVKDISDRDKYNRLLRYVFVDNKFVNYELVKAGLAEAKIWKPDEACANTFSEVQKEARSKGVGMWSNSLVATPTVTLSSTSSQSDANCSPCYPDVCIPPAPPDLSCKDIPYRNFRVVGCDPHGFDGNNDGVGCEN